MKYKYTYLFAFIISAIIAFAFKDVAAVSTTFRVMSVVSIFMGVCFSYFFIVTTMLGSIASLRRSKVFALTLVKSISWMIVVAFLMLVCSYIFTIYLLPLIKAFNFSEMVNTIGNNPLSSTSNIQLPALGGFAGKTVKLFLENPNYIGEFLDFSFTDTIPIWSVGNVTSMFIFLSLFISILVFYIMGYFCKPDLTVIHPIYTVVNSLSEVGFRFGNAVMKLLNVLVFFVAGYWFQNVITSPLLKEATYLLIVLSGMILFFVVILFPLLFVVFTKRNPFPVMYSSIIIGLNSLFSCNVMFSSLMSEVIARQEDNIPRKYVSSVYPVYLILSRVGIASIAYILSLLILKNSSISLTLMQHIMLPLVCVGISIICGCSFGSELILILSGAMAYLVYAVGENILSYNTIITLIVLMPILSGLGSFLDSAVMYYGICAMKDQEADILMHLD